MTDNSIQKIHPYSNSTLSQWAELHVIFLAIKNSLDKLFPKLHIFTDPWLVASWLPLGQDFCNIKDRKYKAETFAIKRCGKKSPHLVLVCASWCTIS